MSISMDGQTAMDRMACNHHECVAAGFLSPPIVTTCAGTNPAAIADAECSCSISYPDPTDANVIL